MENLKFVKSFIFNKAEYFVKDGKGNRGVLKVDYFNNRFEIFPLEDSLEKQMVHELENFAREILGKKHGVDFVAQRER